MKQNNNVIYGLPYRRSLRRHQFNYFPTYTYS